jgi:hypothetical protein
MTKHPPSDDAENTPDGEAAADEERVRAVRERIARGEYRPDPEAIARRILERGDLDDPDGGRDEASAERRLRIVPDETDDPPDTAPDPVDEGEGA